MSNEKQSADTEPNAQNDLPPINPDSIKFAQHRVSRVDPEAYSEVMSQLTAVENEKTLELLMNKSIELFHVQYLLRTIFINNLYPSEDADFSQLNKHIDELIVHWLGPLLKKPRGPRDPATWVFYRYYRQLRIERGCAIRRPSRAEARTICRDAWQLAEAEPIVKKKISEVRECGKKALNDWKTDIELHARIAFSEEFKSLKKEKAQQQKDTGDESKE